jgi:FkbM family methyltransferase
MNYISLKKAIKSILKYFLFQENYFNYIRNKKRVINHNGVFYSFSSPNKLCDFRTKSFSSKEPETLKWIDSFSKESVFWDIGANVGIYSIYAAKSRECNVYSFEPSVFNLETLARNIFMNKLDSNITIMPFAVNNIMGQGNLNMSSTDLGGALSTFDKSYDDSGKNMKVIFKYSIFAISIDQIISNLKIKSPDYIKIDVDGIELLILKGGKNILKKVKGVLIELTHDWLERKIDCEKILFDSGLKNTTKKYLTNTKSSKECYNQIWERTK